MIKPYFNKLINEETGSGLILTLMVLLVLSALGASLGVVTIGSHRLADTTRDSNSAYYIAEAGANMAYEEMKKDVLVTYEDPSITSKALYHNEIYQKLNVDTENNYKEYVNNEFEGQIGGKPTATVRVEMKSDKGKSREYVLIATGEIAGKKREVVKNVEISWIDKNSEETNKKPIIPPNASLIIKDYINFNGGTISGDIYLNASTEKSFRLGESGEYNGENIYSNYNGSLKNIYTAPSWRVNNPDPKYTKIVNSTKHSDLDIPWNQYITTVESVQYPDPDAYLYFPDAKIYKDSNYHEVIKSGNIYINNYRAQDYTLEFKENHKAKKLVISEDLNLKIKTNNKTVTLIVNELDISQGKIEIVDNGTLNLFVLDKITFGGGSQINLNSDSNRFNLYYSGKSDLTVSGAQHINGGMHIKSAKLILTGSGNLKGPIYSNGKSIEVSGGSINNMLLFAPKASVLVNGGGVVQGSIVADQFVLDGGGVVDFQEYDFGNILGESSPESPIVNSPTELISSGANIEQ